jgi:hypothetical protein
MAQCPAGASRSTSWARSDIAPRRYWPHSDSAVPAAVTSGPGPMTALLTTGVIVGSTLKRAPLDPFLIVPALVAVEAAVCAGSSRARDRPIRHEELL